MTLLSFLLLSGGAMIGRVFDGCVHLLMYLANLTGTTYKEINVWIFCVIWPIFTLVLLAAVTWQWLQIRKLKRLLAGDSSNATSNAQNPDVDR